MVILSHLFPMVLIFLSFLAFPSFSAEGPPLSLEVLLGNALRGNGQIQESLQDVELARQQIELARSALFPRASALFLAAPIFEERGNALSSTSNLSNWGPFLRGGVEIVQPLYSFGQISSYREAADKQFSAYTELAEVKKNEILLMTKEFYYGYQMASDLLSLVDSLVSFLEEAEKTATQNQKKDKSGIKPHDLYKLRTALDDLRQKRLQARAGKFSAERAVAWVTSTPITTLNDSSLAAERFEKKGLDEYLRIAKERRPELKALAAGKEARIALRDAKKAQSYPILFVGAAGTYGWSPVRDRQPSIFANDPFNRLEGGVGVGLKFDLEFKRHAAETGQEEAQLMKLKATESYAAPGIELQVKKAFWELEQAIEGLEVARRRRDTAKKWFISNASGWSIGITPPKDLLEALEGEGLAKKNYIETLYSLNLSLARLSQAVGAEVTALKYR